MGGVGKSSPLVRIRIHHNPVNVSRSLPMTFILKTLLKNRSEDPVLLPFDIIEVSDATGKFGSPFTPPQFDPPLNRQNGDPTLIQRRSSNG